MEDRRLADEQFRREIAERLKGLETTFEILRADFNRNIEDIKREIVTVKMGNMELHYSIYGGPKSDDIGLQERLRKQRWIERAVYTGIVAVIVFLGNLVKPVWDKAVTDWVYNSPSEKWKVEQKRPKVKHITVRITRPPEDEEPQTQ